MTPLFLKFDKAALHNTFFDHSWIMAYNGFRNVRVMASALPPKPVGQGDDHRFAEAQNDWTLDEVVMPLKAAVRYGDCAGWEAPAMTSLEASLSEFADFEREIVKGPCVKIGDAVFWQSWTELPLYREGAFQAFKQAVFNLEAITKIVMDHR